MQLMTAEEAYQGQLAQERKEAAPRSFTAPRSLICGHEIAQLLRKAAESPALRDTYPAAKQGILDAYLAQVQDEGAKAEAFWREHAAELAQKGSPPNEVPRRKMTDEEVAAYCDLVGRKYVFDGTEYSEEAPFVYAVAQSLLHADEGGPDGGQQQLSLTHMPRTLTAGV